MKQNKMLLDGWFQDTDIRFLIYLDHAILNQEKIHRGQDSLQDYYLRIADVMRNQLGLGDHHVMGLFNGLPMKDEDIEKGGTVMIDFSASKNLAAIIQGEMIADNESTDKKEDQLIDLHDGANRMQQATMNEMLMILTGYSFESLCEMAHIDLDLDPEN